MPSISLHELPVHAQIHYVRYPVERVESIDSRIDIMDLFYGDHYKIQIHSITRTEMSRVVKANPSVFDLPWRNEPRHGDYYPESETWWITDPRYPIAEVGHLIKEHNVNSNVFAKRKERQSHLDEFCFNFSIWVPENLADFAESNQVVKLYMPDLNGYWQPYKLGYNIHTATHSTSTKFLGIYQKLHIRPCSPFKFALTIPKSWNWQEKEQTIRSVRNLNLEIFFPCWRKYPCDGWDENRSLLWFTHNHWPRVNLGQFDENNIAA